MAHPAKTREQVVAQHRVVAHLARQIAVVHEQMAVAYDGMATEPGHIDYTGSRSAALMEKLGDVLNGMDAFDDGEDRWVDPVFKVAQATWPTRG